jgi:uncharacterized membrane protein
MWKEILWMILIIHLVVGLFIGIKYQKEMIKIKGIFDLIISIIVLTIMGLITPIFWYLANRQNKK